MKDARHDLDLMVRLQKIYDRIAAAMREHAEAPPEVREVEEQNRVRASELEAIEQRLGEHQQDLREVRKREEEFKLELEHFQKQRAIVSNEREFTAVISEIDYATKGLEEAGQRRQELEREIAELEQEIAGRREARPEEEEAQREVVDGWEARREELKKHSLQLYAQTQELEAELTPANRARFQRLLRSKRGSAVVPLLEGSCSACHFSVRLHLQQRVRRCEEIIYCENCRRILYTEDALDAADAG